jgi:hypothetical protein
MTTYGQALDRLQTELARHSAEVVAVRSGARRIGEDRLQLRCLGRDYRVDFPDGEISTADGEPIDEHLAILLLLYLIEAGGGPLQDHWIAFEQISGGAGYSGSFRGRVLGPLLRTFGSHPQALCAAAEALDAAPLAMGDAAVSIPALPRVPIAIVLWAGDDEFAPSASVVFDASVEGYLDAEAVTVLAELATRRMIEAARGGPSEGDTP